MDGSCISHPTLLKRAYASEWRSLVDGLCRRYSNNVLNLLQLASLLLKTLCDNPAFLGYVQEPKKTELVVYEKEGGVAPARQAFCILQVPRSLDVYEALVDIPSGKDASLASWVKVSCFAERCPTSEAGAPPLTPWTGCRIISHDWKRRYISAIIPSHTPAAITPRTQCHMRQLVIFHTLAPRLNASCCPPQVKLESGQPVCTPDDLEEAEAIAKADPEVRRLHRIELNLN